MKCKNLLRSHRIILNLAMDTGKIVDLAKIALEFGDLGKLCHELNFVQSVFQNRNI